MKTNFPVGKLPPACLDHLLRKYTFSLPDDRVLVYPGVGEDAAVIDMGNRWLVAKTDPITFATDEIGWYAVNVNANDVAAAGGTPRWFLSTLLLPEGQTDLAMIERIMGQIAEACRAIGVVPCGGHTEITYGLDRPVVVGVMLGEIEPGRVIRTGGVQVGDAIVLTKGAAIEGTAIIAREKAAELEAHFAPDLLARCRDFLRDPGISVLREAQIATQTACVHAMHDPTEGGVATGLWELATVSSVGLRVEAAAIPVAEETRRLCRFFGLDPLGVIASGALLIAVAPEETASLCAALGRAGISARVIARAVPADEGLTLIADDGPHPLPRFDQDEITRIF